MFEDSVDYKKLARSTESSVPSESLELYKSFFDDDLPEVKLYGAAESKHHAKIPISKSKSTTDISEKLRNLTIRQFRQNVGFINRQYRDNQLISVGPLFKMDGGKDRDYILFNGAAADQAFGEVLRNETSLSFYNK